MKGPISEGRFQGRCPICSGLVSSPLPSCGAKLTMNSSHRPCMPSCANHSYPTPLQVWNTCHLPSRREHYQWNMDIVGVGGVEAEAELLAAIVMFLERVGLGPQDVGIKVSSRKVLQAVLSRFGVLPESFARVCVIVDKMDKLPRWAGGFEKLSRLGAVR